MVVIMGYILFALLFVLTPILLIGLFFVALWDFIDELKFNKKSE